MSFPETAIPQVDSIHLEDASGSRLLVHYGVVA
jgi:hypothetical protein